VQGHVWMPGIAARGNLSGRIAGAPHPWTLPWVTEMWGHQHVSSPRYGGIFYFTRT